MLSQEKLRTIIWEIGQRDPVTPAQDFIVLNMVHPRLGHAYWFVQQKSLDTLKLNDAYQNAEQVLRVYDVTDVDFDGNNAHRFFDNAIQRWAGNYYFDVDRTARTYLVEVGLRRRDGTLIALARSVPTFFDRDRPVDPSLINSLLVKAGGVVGRRFIDHFGAHITDQGSGGTQ